MKDSRPHYGRAFEFDRVVNVFFYTSNTIKLLQARLLFIRHGYELRHFKGHREPYDENYALGTELLLTRAIQQVNEEFGVRSVFFVEDTSVRIECLSAKDDFPGLAIKDWFERTSFEALDRELLRRGGDRRAIVYSDIALYIPTLAQPLFFHGETAGSIAASPPDFEGSVQYPWLTPETFNGWFVPAGSARRLGEMEFEESLTFDFRAKSLGALLSRLEELNAALNLRPTFYTVRRQERAIQGQLSFIPEPKKIVLLVIGHKCAGKTTFSDHMAGYDGVQVYEASTVLRGIAEEEGISITSSDDAFTFLRERGFDPVARKLAEYIDKSTAQWNVVSGLRTSEELLFLKEYFADGHIIMIDADSRIRFERHIRRSRDTEVKTFGEFESQDEAQRQFGGMRLANEVADLIITNEGSIEQYKKKIDEIVVNLGRIPRAVVPKERQFGELHRCLWALGKLGRAATCEKISAETAKLGAPVRVYNTNRALKQVPEFAVRIIQPQVLLRYKLTRRGASALKLLSLVRGSPAAPAQWQVPFE